MGDHRHPEINFEKLFKVMVFAMWLNRSHPRVPIDLKWICQFGMMHSIFFFAYCLLIYSTIFYELKNNNITQACANGILSVIFNVVSLKYLVLIWHKSKFHYMMDEVKADYKLAENLPSDEYDVVLRYAKRGQKLLFIWLKMVIVIGSLFPIKSLILMLYYQVKGNFRYVAVFEFRYPEFIELRKNDLPGFLGVYALFLYYDLYALVTYCAFSPFGPILILHACGQLELVEKRILKTFSKKNNTEESIKNIKGIAKHLTEIYGFVTYLNMSLRIFHELLFKAGAILLPIAFYQIIETAKRGEVSFEFISVLCGAIALCWFPCYYSDILMEKSEDVRMAIYSCGWEAHWDPEIRSLIFLLLTRAVRPIALQTLFRNVCLNALTDIYHQGYAIFNLLNAIYN